MIWKPRLTVAAVIERDMHFLMVEETIAGTSTLNQPAGHVEEGESLVEAVIRETLEETAWTFQPEYLLGIYRWVHDNGDTFIRASFSGIVTDFNDQLTLDPDIDAAKWLSMDDLLQAEQQQRFRSPLVMRCISDYQQGKCFPLDLLQDVD
ncbi:MAG: NUDIX hydrolase [Gammaproteobacteria bacterium]|nr:NUDIX hydrolase [Gammaproteobacteria bacterium]